MSFKLVNMFLWGGESETIIEGQGVSTAQPQVSGVVGADGKIQVTFDQSMNTQPGSPLYSRDSYYLTDLEFGWRIPIYQVDLISDTEVELTPVEWFPHNPRLYTLRVVNATNQYGQVMDPANNTVQFTAQNTLLDDVDDTLGFYTSNSGFESDVASALSPDIDKPLIQNQDPSPGALNVNPTYPITLELIDQEQLIDTDSVKLTVNGTVVYENETDAPGWTITRTPITQGYRYELVHTAILPENSTTTVEVVVADTAPLPNVLDTQYTFEVGVQDFDEPYLENLNPDKSGGDHATSAPLVIGINDEKSGVDASTVTIQVDGVPIWVSDSPQNGWFGSKVAVGSPLYGTGGFSYTLSPPSPLLPTRTYEIRVTASDTATPTNSLIDTYTFDTVIDAQPPQLTNIDPQDGEEKVSPTRGISFTIEDDYQVDAATIKVYLNDVLVWDGSAGGAQPGYTQSVQEVNAPVGGYDMFIIPDVEYRWQLNDVITVRVTADDTVPNTMSEEFTFYAETEPEYPFSIYDAIIRAVRMMDERSPGTIQKLVKGFEGEDNGLDAIWEQMTVEPGKDLEVLFDPYEVDAKWLPWLKSLVGFTRDLSFNATETEIRRLIANAVKFWNEKPTELSVETAIRMATANRFRVRNYFDFRFQSDQTGITEELEDFDPTVIDFGEDVYYGSLCTQLAADTFSIADLPGNLGVYGFTSDNQFLYLQILDGVNKGTYELRDLSPGGFTGRILSTFPAGASATPAQWRLTGGMAEYVTEVRVVGEGEATMGIAGFTTVPAPGDTIDGATSEAKAEVYAVDTDALGLLNSAKLTLRNITGRFIKGEQAVLNGATPTEQYATVIGEMEGVLNIGLLEFLIEQMRPASERLDLVVVDFIDEFSETGDYSQWTADHFSAGTPQVTVAEGSGYAELGALTYLVSGAAAGDYMNDWRDQTTMWKVQGGTTGTILQGFFFAQNMTLQDAYYWEIDYNSQELKLFKRVGGVDTQIGSTVVLPFIFANQQDTVRIDAVAEGANTRIRVKVDGDVFIDEADPQWEKGRIAFATSAGTGRLLAAEVNTVPTIIRRIGPR